MKTNIIIFFLFFFVFTANNNTLAEINISFVDVDYIYSNSKIGKKIDNQIKSEKKKINDKLISYQKDIKNEKEKLINQKKIISEEKFKNQAIDLEKKIKEYNKLISDNNNSFIKYKAEIKSLFLKKLMNIVREYAEVNSIQLILNKKDVIIGQNTMDISNDILKLVNKKMNDIKL
jgi:Skp family chaperone for outer membrane proteins